MNSDFYPKNAMPHKELLNAPIVVERIWMLYTLYYLKRNETFEHIFADCLKSKNEYIYISSIKYFLKIVEFQKICEIYEYNDCYGFRRIFPIIINNIQDDEYRLRFVSALIDRIYEAHSQGTIGSVVERLQEETSRESALLRALNHENNPVPNFREVFGEKEHLRELAKFIIKNEESVNRNKICEIVLSDDRLCRVFIEELFLEKSEGHSKTKPKQPTDSEQPS
jgi:hypothetical protein